MPSKDEKKTKDGKNSARPQAAAPAAPEPEPATNGFAEGNSAGGKSGGGKSDEELQQIKKAINKEIKERLYPKRVPKAEAEKKHTEGMAVHMTLTPEKVDLLLNDFIGEIKHRKTVITLDSFTLSYDGKEHFAMEFKVKQDSNANAG